MGGNQWVVVLGRAMEREVAIAERLWVVVTYLIKFGALQLCSYICIRCKPQQITTFIDTHNRDYMESHIRKREIYRATIIGAIANILLLIFKFVAGIVGRSSAMIADAVHSLSDFVTDIIVLFFVRFSSKPADEEHRYGHGKFETLATAIIGLILLFVGGSIMVDGVKKILAVINGATLEAPGLIALIAAVLSIVVKELVYQYTAYVGKKVNSTTVQANAWHHRSDALSSIGTLAGIGGAIFLGERWRILDPIAAVVVSLFIVKIAISILKTSLDELLEHSLPQSVEEEIVRTILSVEGVTSPHQLRTRRIGNSYAIEIHIRMDGNISLKEAHAKTTEVELRLKSQYGPSTLVTIHTEPIKESCGEPR